MNARGKTGETAADRYFLSIRAALDGLDLFLRDTSSPLTNHDLAGRIVSPYIGLLEASFRAWQNRLTHSPHFRISRADSGFPVHQHVLELEKDRRTAGERLSALPDADTLRAEMADFILRQRAFPKDLQAALAERLYLEGVKDGSFFISNVLPETVKVGVNPKTGRPWYVTHWGAFDGSANLPLVYSAVIEDSTPDMVRTLVGKDGKLDRDVTIPLPVGGLLNPQLAKAFDRFAEAHSSYSLSPVTIATNLDEEFATLHPKQLRRIVLGPFYSAGITDNNDTISTILEKVKAAGNAWLLTWTIQDVQSIAERPGKKGLFSSEPPRETFHIETSDLEAARMGVSAYEKHALIPHEAYQALYAAGQAERIFAGYKTHIISGGQVVSGL